MQQIPISLLTLLAGVLVTLVSLWVGQHHGLLPEQASEQAPLVDGLFNTMLTIGTALFLVVQGTIVIFLWRYRQRKNDNSDGVPLEGNLPLEIVWTAIPAIIVIGLGIYSTEVYQQMGGLPSSPLMGHSHVDSTMAHHSEPVAIAATLPGSEELEQPISSEGMPPTLETAALTKHDRTQQLATTYGITGTGLPGQQQRASDVVVNVTALQFAWIFNYPDQGITSGELHVPLGQDVQLNLAAQDVIHSFWVPQFRLKQDVIPGQQAELRFKATRLGEYPIVCTELCGAYHGAMRTRVIVQSPEDFDQWKKDNTFAQTPDPADAQTRIAIDPSPVTDTEFLAAYAQDLGVQPLDLTHRSVIHDHHFGSHAL